MRKIDESMAIYLLVISLLGLALTLFLYTLPSGGEGVRKTINSEITEDTLPIFLNPTLQVIEHKPFNPKDFKCRFVQEINFCTQNFKQKVGETYVMGEYNSLLNTIFVRLTDDRNANIGRLQHEVTHYMLYKYTSVYTIKEIRTTQINEKIAYETQILFENMLNYIN